MCKNEMKEYEELMRLELEHTRRMISIVKGTKMDKEAAYEEYYIRKGRMMGAKPLNKRAAEQAHRNIHDLRMTHHNMVFRPLHTTTTTTHNNTNTQHKHKQTQKGLKIF
jgi:hypothetical protein